MTQDTKTKLQNSSKTENSKTQTQRGLQKLSKNTTKTEIDTKCTKQGNKTSGMSNELHVCTDNRIITGKTNEHPNKKHTAKTYSTNIRLLVKPQDTESIRIH